MNLITTVRHLRTPPTEQAIGQLTTFLDSDVIDLAATYGELNAIAFMLSADGSHLLSFTAWPDDVATLDAEVSHQHQLNSELIERMVPVSRPREQAHYRLLTSRNLGGPAVRPRPRA